MQSKHPHTRIVLSTASLVALAALASSCGNAFDEVEPEPGSSSAALGAAHVADEILVQYTAAATPSDTARARGRFGGAHRETVRTAAMQAQGTGDLERVAVPPGLAIHAAIQAAKADPAVTFAEPNWIYEHQVVSNDPYYTGGQLWGMYGDDTTPANTFGSRAGQAWAQGHTCDANVYVGVIDEGIMVSHADLVGNVWVNPFDPVNGIDDDGNGYVDDTWGWDFQRNERRVDNGAMDHGTHVAGTIGATGGNGAGVAGVCWTVKLISAQFLGRTGGLTSDAVKAVDYLTDLKTRHGINVVASNNSWGGGGYSQALFDAIERANEKDILFVAAAGNDGDDIDSFARYPAAYSNSNIIAVAALSRTGGLASWSNYGDGRVDLGAPGVEILSTVPGKRGASAYGTKSGTSMAAPHVTGAAALYAASHAGTSAATIKNALLSATIPTPSLAGKTLTGGRLNVQGF